MLLPSELDNTSSSTAECESSSPYGASRQGRKRMAHGSSKSIDLSFPSLAFISFLDHSIFLPLGMSLKRITEHYSLNSSLMVRSCLTATHSYSLFAIRSSMDIYLPFMAFTNLI